MRIALTGNPNSGKTTMYNALTGRNEKVGNWAGVTVDKKEYTVKKTSAAARKSLHSICRVHIPCRRSQARRASQAHM